MWTTNPVLDCERCEVSPNKRAKEVTALFVVLLCAALGFGVIGFIIGFEWSGVGSLIGAQLGATIETLVTAMLGCTQ